MYELDSRALGPLDCYGQRFMRPGTYRYAIVQAGARGLYRERPYLITVTGDQPGEMAQHNVTVTRGIRGFTADPAELTIATGDLVLWHGVHGEYPFEIAGDKAFFDSTTLRNECGYSHVFSAPGDYRWADAHGGPVRGRVVVRDPQISGPDAATAWMAQLSDGHVVMIDGDKAEPAELEIVTGQTVYFAVITGDGVTVTDETLLGGLPSQA